MSIAKMFSLRRSDRLDPRSATAFARVLFISLLALTLSGAAAAGAAAAGCEASTLSGYQHMRDLTGQGFILHWSLATPSRLDIAVEAKPGSGAENGWISVGWSANGKMAPADAVIGNLPGVAVGAYDISGYDGTTVVASTTFKISGGLLSSANGRSTIIKFSRSQGDGGSAPLVLTGPATNTIIWGYSAAASKALDYHGTFQGSAKISFNCGGGNSTATTPVPTPATPTPAPGSTGAGGAGGSTSGGTSSGSGSGSSSSGAANLPACDASTLAGYEHSKDLTGKGFLLHWTLTPAGQLDMALEAKPASGANKGWISLGWSAAGKMYPADTVIGNLPDGSVGAYDMSGYDASAVLPSTKFKISKASTVAANGGSTIIKFSRSKGDGGISPLVLTGPATNTIIWSYSADDSKALDYHGTFRGSAKISFNCNSNAAQWRQFHSPLEGQRLDHQLRLRGGNHRVATAVESGAKGKTVVKFTRQLSVGSFPINANGVTKVIWAYSADGSQSLANHMTNRGSASIDFISGSTTVSSTAPPSTTLLVVHAWLLGIAFGILMPAAILISRIFLADKLQERPPGVDHDKWEAQVARAKSWKPLAFETHKWMQITAVAIAIAGCIIVFVQSGSVGLQSSHGQLGLAIFVLIFVQPMIGHFRPNKGTVNRPTWFVIHWVLGIGIVGLAWLNTFLGFDIMQTKYSFNLQWCYIIFGVTVGLLGAIYLVIYITDQVVALISMIQKATTSNEERDAGKQLVINHVPV
ncbi:unnamed protein product [Closterium sp. NIES-65]|nr:unnamed protein product [Closterium sp. NIES-65]